MTLIKKAGVNLMISKITNYAKNMENLNNIFMAVFFNVFGNLVMLLTTFIMVKTMTSDDYGSFRLLFTVFSFIAITIMLGRDSTILRLANDDKSAAIWDEVRYGIYSIVIGTGAFVYFADEVINIVFSNNVTKESYILSLVMLPLWGIYNMLTPLLRVNGRQNYVFFLNNFLLRFLKLPFFLIFLFLLSNSLKAAIYTMIAAQAFMLFLTLPMVISLYKHNRPNDSGLSVGFLHNLFPSLNLCFNSVIFILLTTLTVVLVNKNSGVGSVAVFDIVVLICTLMLFPFMALAKSSEPYLRKNDPNSVSKIQKNKKYSLLVVLTGCFIVIVFSKELLVIFGPEYISGQLALVFMAALFFISTLFGLSSEWLNMSGRARYNTISLVLCLGLSFFIGRELISEKGVVGGALTLGFCYVFYKLLSFLFAVRLNKLETLRLCFSLKAIGFSFIILIISIVFSIVFSSFIIKAIFSVPIIALILILLIYFDESFFSSRTKNVI